MRRDQLNDEYLELLDKQRLYFKTVKDFKEVRDHLHDLVTNRDNDARTRAQTVVRPLY